MDDDELPTEQIFHRFGSDPRPPRTRRFVLRDGEMFCREGSKATTCTDYFPKYSSITRYGPLYHEHLQMDSGILSFNCYLSEPESEVFCEEQIYRVRPMKLLYYLVDDTMSLNEPPVDNSGIMQGRVFTRQKVPRSDDHIGREFIHWSDLNVAQDIVLFARTYRITSCDHYTKDFLERNGIKVREAEEIPLDPWTKRRSAKRSEAMANSTEINGFVNAPAKLHLLACWLDSSNDFHGSRQRRTFRMTVFTVDDTVTLVETTPGLEGQVFLKRINLPCKAPRSRRYYRSWELRPGVWVDIFTRPMFIYGCEGTESRAFLQQQHGQTDFSDYERVLDEGPPVEHIVEIPSTLKFIAEMLNGPFTEKKFVLTYHVNSQEVDIAESGMRRKWSIGRAFLEGIHSHNYSIDHFTIGSTLTFYRWSFKLVEADPNTLQYLRSKDMRGYEAA